MARLDGQVVFVRHALPGERARIRITERRKKYLRADAIEIIRASEHRITPACPYAGRCGGCDFQHVNSAHQRELLAGIVVEHMARIAKIDVDVRIEAADPDDYAWRTRSDFAVAPDGRLGFRAHRSHEVVPVEDCRIAHANLPDVLEHTWDASFVRTVVTSTGQRVVITDARTPPQVEADVVIAGDAAKNHRGNRVHERVHDTEFEIHATGFWQVHPQAAEILVDAVSEAAAVRPGQRIADLYAGAGLFSVFLARAAGPSGSLVSIESNPDAVQDARRNLAAYAWARCHRGPVERLLPRLDTTFDTVVLDPPRAGAKAAIEAIVATGAHRIVYVACDPAALARDTASLLAHGYRLDQLRGFQLFPMTHHVECVAAFTRSDKSG